VESTSFESGPTVFGNDCFDPWLRVHLHHSCKMRVLANKAGGCVLVALTDSGLVKQANPVSVGVEPKRLSDGERRMLLLGCHINLLHEDGRMVDLGSQNTRPAPRSRIVGRRLGIEQGSRCLRDEPEQGRGVGILGCFSTLRDALTFRSESS
jgi:hypothetical protein